MKNKVPPVLSLFRCYSTLFLNAQQAYLNNHISPDGIDHGGHTMEAATAEACKTVAEAQRDDTWQKAQAIYEAKIREIFEEIEERFSIEGHHIPMPSIWDKFIITRKGWQALKDRKW